MVGHRLSKEIGRGKMAGHRPSKNPHQARITSFDLHNTATWGQIEGGFCQHKHRHRHTDFKMRPQDRKFVREPKENDQQPKQRQKVRDLASA